MGSFIQRKKKKVLSIFQELGNKYDEKLFIELFKERYPDDWTKINLKWEEEEKTTPKGRKHPMKPPDVYMKEMYRNWKKYSSYLADKNYSQ